MLLSFLRRILFERDLATCGVLADWLEEQGDARGVLLRQWWRDWEERRAWHESRSAAQGASGWVEQCDAELINRVIIYFLYPRFKSATLRRHYDVQ